MNAYELKRAAKKERFAELAAKRKAEANALYKEGTHGLDQIPFGQPILVGHHSEKADRNYRARHVRKIEKSFELQDAADYYQRKAESDSDIISQDDPDAPQKLAAKLAKLEAERENIKKANKALKAKGEPIMPAYMLANLSARVRDIKLRIARIEKTRALPADDKTHEGNGKTIRVFRNPEANRLQLFFSEIPSQEIRDMLKSGAFRWSPTEGAWQAFISNRSAYRAELIVQKFLAL